MNENFEKWVSFLESNIKSKKRKIALENYVKTILSNNSVVIFEFNHLSKLLGIERDYLAKMIFESELFYHTFTIPKRNGKPREICSPSEILLYVQRWIYDNILKSIDLNDNCVGFREKHTIKDNVKKHLNQEYILKIDLKDFFPSINKRRVISVFRNIGYSTNLSYLLASLCTLNDALPQGAPTSPYLSNIIAKRLDRRLTGFAKKFNLNFTRYADDITISGNIFPKKLISYIEQIILDEGFNLNHSKTRLLYRNNRRIITGISISSNKLTIPKKKKRIIRQSLHYIKTYGLSNHLEKNNIKDPIYLERLLGYLYFWKFVEPENNMVLNYIAITKAEIEKINKSLRDFQKADLEFIG